MKSKNLKESYVHQTYPGLNQENVQVSGRYLQVRTSGYSTYQQAVIMDPTWQAWTQQLTLTNTLICRDRTGLMLHTQDTPAAPVSNKVCRVKGQSSQVKTCTSVMGGCNRAAPCHLYIARVIATKLKSLIMASS